MHTVELVTSVPAPVERAWAALCDSQRWGEWQPIRTVTVHSAEGLGPLVEYTVRGRGVHDRYRVTEFDPPRRFAYEMISGNLPLRHYRSEQTLISDGAGTELRSRVTFEPVVPGTGWLFQRVIAVVFGRMARAFAATLW